MIRVVQGDFSVLGVKQQSNAQSLPGQQGDPFSHAERIKTMTREALQSAEARGMEKLLLPVINSGVVADSVSIAARVMVPEVRRHLCLSSSLQEITFALADLEGVSLFNELVERSRVVCLGDSITHGYPDGPDFSWVQVVQQATGWEMVNKGVSGETTGEMLQRYATDVRSEKPAYLIFAGGHNDGWRDVPVEEACDNIKRVAALALQDGICPILVLPSPLNIQQMLQSFEGTYEEGVAYNNKLQQIRTWIAQYASAQGLLTLDFYSPLLDILTGQGNPHYLLDGGHPTHEGYRVLGKSALEQLQGRLHL